MDPSDIRNAAGEAIEGARKGLEQAGSDVDHHFEEARKTAEGVANAAGEGAANLELDKKASEAGEAVGSGLQQAGDDIGNAIEKAKDRAEEIYNAGKDAAENLDFQQGIDEAGKWAKAGFDVATNKAQEFDFKEAACDVKDWIAEHPYQTGFHVAAGITFFAPGIVMGPILGLAGFGAGGITGGSMAAAWHASAGPVAARSAFAFLQSAGAAGYGAPVVNGVAQGVVAMGEALKLIVDRAKAREADDGDGEGESGHEEAAEERESEESDNELHSSEGI